MDLEAKIRAKAMEKKKRQEDDEMELSNDDLSIVSR